MKLHILEFCNFTYFFLNIAGSFVSSFGLGHLSPESKGSNSSMDQNQIGSYEAPSLGMSHPDDDVQDKER